MTTGTEIELLPCRGCGVPPLCHYIGGADHGYLNEWQITCTEPDCHDDTNVFGPTREAAVKAWNQDAQEHSR
jgi:hypothetical protein